MIEEEREKLSLAIREVYMQAMRKIQNLRAKPPSSFEEQEGRRHVEATIREAADLEIAPLFKMLCESLATEESGNIRVLNPIGEEHIARARQLITGQ
jgi:hypothetical protein